MIDPNDPDSDAAKKKADADARQQMAASQGKLGNYFSGAKQPPAPSAQAPQPQAAPPSTNVGQGAQLPMPQAVQPTPAPPPQPAQQPASRAPAPTGFTNYQRYFNVNKQNAQNEAAKLASGVQSATDRAGASLEQAKKDFGGGVQQDAMKRERLQALQAKMASDWSRVTPQDLAELKSLEADIAAGYQGPMGLDDKQAQIDAEAANQQLNAIGSASGRQALIRAAGGGGSVGANRLSGALTGAGGDFSQLRARFNPSKDIADAQANAVKTAQQIKDEEARVLSRPGAQETAPGAPQAAAAKAPPPTPHWQDRNNPMAYINPSNANDVAAESQKFAQFGQAMQHDVGDDLREGVRTLSPFDNIYQAVAGGQKSPLDQEFSDLNYNIHKNGGQGEFGGNYQQGVGGGNQSGGKGEHIKWGPNDYIVFRQMDPAQWAKLQSLGKEGQVQWIAQRRRDLAPGWKQDEVEAQKTGTRPKDSLYTY